MRAFSYRAFTLHTKISAQILLCTDFLTHSRVNTSNMENLYEYKEGSEDRRNEHTAAIQKARTDMTRLLAAQKAVTEDEELTEKHRKGLLRICSVKADHIYESMMD